MPTSIRLAPETEQRLDYLASHTGRSKAYYLRQIIEQGIDEMACSLKFVWQPCRYTIDRSKAVLKLYRGNVYTITQKWHTRGE